MTTAIRPTQIRIPFVNIEFQITARDKKVVAVALATLALLGLQMGLPLGIALATSFAFSLLTYLSEKHLRKEQNDWFNADFNKKEMLFWTAFLLLRPLILQAICFALGIPLPVFAQVELVDRILQNPWVMLPIVTIVAPIAEEILFRGFLLERLEDILGHKKVSNGVQAVIFGALHLKQKIKESWEIPVFLILSGMGYIFGEIKQKDRTLISPIAFHSANNTSAMIHIFASR